MGPCGRGCPAAPRGAGRRPQTWGCDGPFTRCSRVGHSRATHGAPAGRPVKNTPAKCTRVPGSLPHGVARVRLTRAATTVASGASHQGHDPPHDATGHPHRALPPHPRLHRLSPPGPRQRAAVRGVAGVPAFARTPRAPVPRHRVAGPRDRGTHRRGSPLVRAVRAGGGAPVRAPPCPGLPAGHRPGPRDVLAARGTAVPAEDRGLVLRHREPAERHRGVPGRWSAVSRRTARTAGHPAGLHPLGGSHPLPRGDPQGHDGHQPQPVAPPPGQGHHARLVPPCGGRRGGGGAAAPHRRAQRVHRSVRRLPAHRRPQPGPHRELHRVHEHGGRHRGQCAADLRLPHHPHLRALRHGRRGPQAAPQPAADRAGHARRR